MTYSKNTVIAAIKDQIYNIYSEEHESNLDKPIN